MPKKADQPTKVWYSQAESAEYLITSDRTIRNYVARGLLPARRIRGSRSIRIHVDDLNAMLEPIPSAKAG